MSHDTSDYDLGSIRELLLAAFTVEDLRRFCLDDARFRPIHDRFAPGHGLDDLVDQVIDYCSTHSLWPEFLAAVRQARSRTFARFEARLGGPPLAPGGEGRRAPGALPPIWQVPYARNPNFVGREDLLEPLRAALTSGQPGARVQALTGLGGVGKTQLALEYAYRTAGDYDAVWWVRAEEPATLAAEYARLAGPARLPEADLTDLGEVVAAVRNWLARTDGWLLIFDHASDPESLRGTLPQGALGQVIITSRNPAWRGVAQTRPVEEMARADSIAFLCWRTAQQDEAAAGALAEKLGDLPLALEQAGAYVETTGIPLADYCALFDTRRAELWAVEAPPAGYPDTVAAAWRLAMDQVEGKSPAAASLLSLCAFLGPEDIPRDLISGGAAWVPGSLAATLQNPLAFHAAVAAVRRYSLLEVSGDVWEMHRLVGAVVRDRLEDEAKREWAGAAVRLVDDAFPSDIPDDPATWPQCLRLLPHALAAAAHAETLGVAPEATGHLLNQAGLYLQVRAQFREAKSALERALAIDEAVLGPDHPNVGNRVNNLGEMLRELGDYVGARAAFQRAIAIGEATLGLDHPMVATCASNLGGVLFALGDYADARAAFQRALAIDEAALGPDHPNVARDVNNLGLVLHALGDYQGARGAYERALAIDEAAYGPDHPNVAIKVSNLGEVLRELGDYKGARAAFQRAIAIGEATLGPNHPDVAVRVNNLGLVLQALGDYTEARAAFQRVLPIFEAILGPGHPHVATCTNNLGLVLHALGDYEGARAAFQQALGINETVLGPEHPNVARDVSNLGSALQALGDYEGARAAFQQALAIFEQALPPDHPDLRTVRGHLAALQRDLDQQ